MQQSIQFEVNKRIKERGAHILNSGNCWYLENSASHSASDWGGFISLTRCQSTMESPDSVNLIEANEHTDVNLWCHLKTRMSNIYPDTLLLSMVYLVTPPNTTAPTTSPLQPSNQRPSMRFVAALGTVTAAGVEGAPASTVMVLWFLFTSHLRSCGLRW